MNDSHTGNDGQTSNPIIATGNFVQLLTTETDGTF